MTRRRLIIVGGSAAAALALAGCTSGALDRLDTPNQPPPPGGEPAQPSQIGSGQIRVGLILPLSAQGNAGVAAQSMKNAAEMALAEF